MASRESVDSTSTSGKSYPAGTAAATPVSTVKGISQSKNMLASTVSKAAALATNPIEVFADGAVWDTVAGVYLFPGRDYNPGDLQRK